jgi:protein phosphatase
MRWEQQVEYAAKTDVGLRRQNNEDACIAQLAPDEAAWRPRGHLFVVADGMGGHAVGELASKIAVDILPHAFRKLNVGDARGALRAAVETANRTIHARGSHNRDFQRMGTTCTALALCSEGAVIAHVGDSRAYRIRRDRIDQLTFDHSLQWELERRGRLAPRDLAMQGHRNIITRSLGPESHVEVDAEGPHVILPDDVYVLCSDGLTSHVHDGEIAAIAGELSPPEASRLLVHLANLRGGTDNCTVIVVRVGALPANVPLPEEQPRTTPPPVLGWRWLLGFWLVGVVLVSGLTLLLFSHLLPGLVLALLSLCAGSLLTVSALRERRRLLKRGQDERRELQEAGPYRSSVARPVRELIDELASLSQELQRTAEEDGWNVNWEEHGRAVQAASDAVAARRRVSALREFARAIDLLMSSVQSPQRIRA